ncbi:MAG: ABC transporter ATP-binding protein [Phycisphaeraceae bacterium]|nr:ABC transporter ATP-binding protein [Phycisphaeraceae bacterium]
MTLHNNITHMPGDESITNKGGIGVTLRDVERRFDDQTVAFQGINLEVNSGEFVALLGPSGCGKSTLLRLVAGLDRPQKGTVSLGGRHMDATTGRSDLAFVFQDAQLLPWRNVLGNVALPLELQGIDKVQREAAAQRAIAEVGLNEAIRRYPAQLSGGMKMRVSLARALVTQPRLLLLDEPFAALDEMTRHRLDEQLRDLWNRLNMTVLFVTHSITEAVYLAQRAVVLSKRPARIVADERFDLPRERTHVLREDQAFSRWTAKVYKILEREGA